MGLQEDPRRTRPSSRSVELRRALALVALLPLIACGRDTVRLRSALTSEQPPATVSATASVQTSPAPEPKATTRPQPEPTPAPPQPADRSGKGSGIVGTVQAGPTCPVQTQDSPCPDRPVAGADVTARKPSGRVAGKTKSDENGRFRLPLKAGTYDVTATSRNVFGCDTQRVTVEAQQFRSVTITCDTGIR